QVGLAVRASAENVDRAHLMGVPVNRVRTIVWVIAALLSGVAIFQRTLVLNQPPAGIGSYSQLLYGLAPAVIARMVSFPVALAAGVALGAVDQAVFYATRNANVSSAIIL